MKSIIPRFNAQRMVMEYVRDYYALARQQRLVMMGKDYTRARELAPWRRKVEQCWPKIHLRLIDPPPAQINAGQHLSLRVAAFLNGLAADDVLVECLVGVDDDNGDFITRDRQVFTAESVKSGDETLFHLNLEPRLPGLQYYKVRLYPFHPALAHRFQAGLMLWL